jgi:hypothetical protein
VAVGRLQHFVNEYDEVALGVGEHVVHALLKDPYLATMTPESVVELTATTLPYFVASMPGGIEGVDAELPPGIPELLDDFRSQPSDASYSDALALPPKLLRTVICSGLKMNPRLSE